MPPGKIREVAAFGNAPLFSRRIEQLVQQGGDPVAGDRDLLFGAGPRGLDVFLVQLDRLAGGKFSVGEVVAEGVGLDRPRGRVAAFDVAERFRRVFFFDCGRLAFDGLPGVPPV